MNDLITVIINVYNGEKFIKKCLDSIINQTYKNLEILIVNDGSTDNTLKEIKKYKDKRIKVITTKNQGLSFSRNTAIDNAKGEYLYFVDVDDFIEKDTIDYLYKLITDYDVKIATCDSLKIKNYDFRKVEKEEKVEVYTSEEMLKLNLLSIINHSTCTWNKLYKKEIFNDNRFNNPIINDLSLTYKLFITAKKIVYSNQIKYYYLIHDTNVTLKKRENLDRLIGFYDTIIDKYNYIDKIYPNMYENKIGLLIDISVFYIRKNKEFHKYLKEKKAVKLYKKYYSLKIFKYKLSKKIKIELLLFRISPKLYKFFANIYLKIKKVI